MILHFLTLPNESNSNASQGGCMSSAYFDGVLSPGSNWVTDNGIVSFDDLLMQTDDKIEWICKPFWKTGGTVTETNCSLLGYWRFVVV
jgi:hypothetical protein